MRQLTFTTDLNQVSFISTSPGVSRCATMLLVCKQSSLSASHAFVPDFILHTGDNARPFVGPLALGRCVPFTILGKLSSPLILKFLFIYLRSEHSLPIKFIFNWPHA